MKEMGSVNYSITKVNLEYRDIPYRYITILHSHTRITNILSIIGEIVTFFNKIDNITPLF